MEFGALLIWSVLFWMLLFKDMSGKDELKKIREELEKMNRRADREGVH